MQHLYNIFQREDKIDQVIACLENEIKKNSSSQQL